MRRHIRDEKAERNAPKVETNGPIQSNGLYSRPRISARERGSGTGEDLFWTSGWKETDLQPSGVLNPDTSPDLGAERGGLEAEKAQSGRERGKKRTQGREQRSMHLDTRRRIRMLSTAEVRVTRCG